MLEKAPVEIKYGREDFDPKAPDFGRWLELCDAHALELRGMKADIDIDQYQRLQKQGRLVLIMARNIDGLLIGYSSHFWHRDLHFNQKIAQDDAWYVIPELRVRGIGRKLREMTIEELRKDGVKYVYGRLKTAHPHDDSMTSLGYFKWEDVYIKEI